ncbi:MAG TPA: TfoX/Sxy family protein [Anaerolineaceae bacterium]|nr:TfoX/Sxy family protein [Anaerolineaceae bacterium]
MAYDETLAQRIRAGLVPHGAFDEKKMFGGVGFLLHGNMVCGIHKNSLIVRVGPEKHTAAMAKPHVRPFDMTGRPMTGWILVEPGGFDSDEDLSAWIELGVDYARGLPPK